MKQKKSKCAEFRRKVQKNRINLLIEEMRNFRETKNAKFFTLLYLMIEFKFLTSTA